jgi:hypothetical protein
MNFFSGKVLMERDYPLELESFSSKVRIVEQKLGVAMEEFEVDNNLQALGKIDIGGPALCEENYNEAATVEETKAFVSKRKSFEFCVLF